MSARWTVGSGRWRRCAWGNTNSGARCAEAGPSRHSRPCSRRARGMLAGRVHGTANLTRSSTGARSRACAERWCSGSALTLRTRPLEDRFAALHSAQSLRRSFGSFVDRARPCLRHNHALDGRRRSDRRRCSGRFPSRSAYRSSFHRQPCGGRNQRFLLSSRRRSGMSERRRGNSAGLPGHSTGNLRCGAGPDFRRCFLSWNR